MKIKIHRPGIDSTGEAAANHIIIQSIPSETLREKRVRMRKNIRNGNYEETRADRL